MDVLQRLNVAGFCSGGGTTWNSILNAALLGKGGLSKVRPCLTVVSTPRAGVLEKLYDPGLGRNCVAILEPEKFPTPEDFGDAILQECEKRDVDFIGMYGWLPKMPRNVIEFFRGDLKDGMMVNQHPAWPHLFGGKGMWGKRPHLAALIFGVCMQERGDYRWMSTAAVSQRVHPEFDKGAILRAIAVPMFCTDSYEKVQERVLPMEHEVQIETLRDFSEGTVRELKDVPQIRWRDRKYLAMAKLAARVAIPKEKN